MNITNDSWSFALNHLEKYGETDVFPKYCDVYKHLAYCFQNSGEFNIMDLLKSASFAKPCLDKVDCWIPKSKYTFRKCDILDPLMTVLYTAWVYQHGEQLEQHRQPKNIVYSYRFVKNDPEFRFFDKELNFYKFQAASLDEAKSDQYTHVVTADICDFYNQIYLHRLQNALEACKIDTSQTKDIEAYLSKLNSKQSHALPVGSAASRLLAEIILHRFDVAMLTHVSARNAKYLRFSDDFKIFVKSFEDGVALLEHLHSVIYVSDGLALQSTKTRIIPVHQYIKEMEPSIEGLESVYTLVRNQICDYTAIDWSSIKLNEEDINLDKLCELLKEEIVKPDPSSFIVSSCLGILGKFKSTKAEPVIFNNLIDFVRFAREVFEYLARIADTLDDAKRKTIIQKLFDWFGKYSTSFAYFWMLFFDMIAENPKLWKFTDLTDKYNSPENKIRSGTMLELYFCKMIAALGINAVYLAMMSDKFSTISKFTQRAMISAVGNMKSESSKFMLESFKEKSEHNELNLQMLEFASGSVQLIESGNAIFSGKSFCLIGEKSRVVNNVIKSHGGKVTEFKKDCICIVDAQELPTCVQKSKYKDIITCTIVSVEFINECKQRKQLLDLNTYNIASHVNQMLGKDKSTILQLKKEIKTQFITE